ncbi:MAG: hypothetical protein ACXWB1_00825 [Kaistella sp.]
MRQKDPVLIFSFFCIKAKELKEKNINYGLLKQTVFASRKMKLKTTTFLAPPSGILAAALPKQPLFGKDSATTPQRIRRKSQRNIKAMSKECQSKG